LYFLQQSAKYRTLPTFLGNNALRHGFRKIAALMPRYNGNRFGFPIYLNRFDGSNIFKKTRVISNNPALAFLDEHPWSLT
jgi:hypothetical protein